MPATFVGELIQHNFWTHIISTVLKICKIIGSKKINYKKYIKNKKQEKKSHYIFFFQYSTVL